MATKVCQGLQTQFNPWLIEPRGIGFDFSLSSRCALSPPILKEQGTLAPTENENCFAPQTFQDNKVCETNSTNKLSVTTPSKNEDAGGWSCLQALSNLAKSSPQETEKVYVHPLAKRSASKLSEKSLEMCTESLGSETGSDIMSENGDELVTFMSSEMPQKLPRLHHFGERKRSNVASNFPPPLTTIRNGFNGGGVRVEAQREDGRLVMKAVSVEVHQRLFKAERKDGRLRLHFLPSSSCSQMTSDDNEELLDDHDNKIDEDYGHYSDDSDGQYSDDADNDGEYDYNDYNDDENNQEFTKETEGNNQEFDDQAQVGRYSGTRRCKERLNWEQFRVLTC